MYHYPYSIYFLSYPDEITEEGKQIVEDALDCMQCLASKLEGCQALACNEAMTTLSKLAINSNKPAGTVNFDIFFIEY